MQIHSMLRTAIFMIGTGVLQMAPTIGFASSVSIGDPTDGGAKYHLNFMFDNANQTLTAYSGQSLSQTGSGAYTDSGTDNAVDTVASKSFHDLGRLGGTSSDPILPGTFGWTHTSRWSLIDLNGLYDTGITQIKLSVKLQSDDQGSGASDLIPGLTLWQAKEDAGNYSAMYVNGIDSTNWSEWNGEGVCSPATTCSYFPTLAQSALDGKVWSAADDRDNPTHMAMVMTDWITLTGDGNNYFTVVFGGNADLGATGVAQNFLATVSVQPVPVPGAVWLFGSAMAGLIGMGRRKTTLIA